MNDRIGVAFAEESKNRANRTRDRIHHCLDQIDEDGVWWTPGEDVNSVGAATKAADARLPPAPPSPRG